MTTTSARAAPRTAQLAPYRQPLQVPPAVDLTKGGSYTLTATHLTCRLHPALPAATNVWSYVGQGADPAAPYTGYLGPTLVVRRGQPVTVSYVNGLDARTYAGAPWLPCDRNLTANNDDTVRLLAHLHGGFVWGHMDGNPAVDAGYTQGHTQTVWYGNEQRAALNWYHEHGMGNTRLNVWAGLAGGYVVRDEIDTGERSNPNGLPSGYGVGPGHYEVPLVFQDRSFVNSADSGDFLYTATPQVPGGAGSYGLCGNDPNVYGTNTPGPWWPEGFGDTMLVNGLCTPVHAVEPRLYRLRVLNGCNARIVDLQLTGGQPSGTTPPMYVIGTDGGLIPAPVLVKTLTLMPGERLDVLVDFSKYAGQKLFLKNSQLNGAYVSPAPRLVEALQFTVGTVVTDATNNTVPSSISGGEWANSGLATIGPRYISANEANAGSLHWYMALTGSGAGGVDVPPTSYPDATSVPAGARYNCFHDPIGELPPAGGVQEWDFANNTMDSHPMHMHLVQFQVVHRRNIGVAAGGIADGRGVAQWEKGWKDTVAVQPGTITRVRARFSLPAQTPPIGTPAGFQPAGTSPHYNLRPGEAERTFVYHCHILEHEENDMMRPFRVS